MEEKLTMARTVPSTPSPPRVGRLDSLVRVRREMSRLYKEARQGQLPSTEATKLTFILQAIGKLLEIADTEARLEDLERVIAGLDRKYHI